MRALHDVLGCEGEHDGDDKLEDLKEDRDGKDNKCQREGDGEERTCSLTV